MMPGFGGKSGRGLSLRGGKFRRFSDSAEEWLDERICELFATRRNNFLGLEGLSDSSLVCDEKDTVGECNEGGGEGRPILIVTWRKREMAMVASTAISRQRAGSRGFVVKTTK